MRRVWVKGICALLCVALLDFGLLGGMLFAVFDAYDRNDFYGSNEYWEVTNRNLNMAAEGFELLRESEEYGLTNYQRSQLAEIETALDPANSNFRFCYRTEDGTVLYSNTDDDPGWTQTVYRVFRQSFVLWVEADVISDPDNGVWYEYDPDDSTYAVPVQVEYGVLAPLLVEDAYQTALARYERFSAAAPALLAGSAGSLLLGLILLALLVRFAGWRPGRVRAERNLLDRIPYDLFLAAVVLLWIGCGTALGEAFYYLRYRHYIVDIAAVLLGCLVSAVIVLAVVLTTATRIKTRTLFKNTVLWRLGGAFKRFFQTLPMTWRTAALFLLYLLGTLLTGITVILIPFYQGVVLWLVCRWALQWRRVREATEAIVAGQADVKINHAKFYPDLRQHAEQLNDLGSAIDHAVEERLKSERFKTELITNVSHDLKTPLTSIINYVDLLKKEDIENPKAQEYIEVLDRKSQRLKKLTEDLVEASKASTGTLAVNRERLDMAQLSEQAAGEYEERLTAAGLTLVKTLPEGPVWIDADGRHLWRVLDNLLGNCAKYALTGTRVYLDVSAWDGCMVLTVKNISAQPLNIPPEQLMERFVRGDESRTEEGSGLGLSIARSLTELQGGKFSLGIDGDLFKAAVMFPLAQ